MNWFQKNPNLKKNIFLVGVGVDARTDEQAQTSTSSK